MLSATLRGPEYDHGAEMLPPSRKQTQLIQQEKRGKHSASQHQCNQAKLPASVSQAHAAQETIWPVKKGRPRAGRGSLSCRDNRVA